MEVVMKPRHETLFLLIALLLFATIPTAAQDKETVVARDLYGDPLPPGAIARLGTTRLRHHRGKILDAAFAGDGKVLASLAWDSRLRIWDAASGKEVQQTDLKSMSMLDACVAMSFDGKMVAASSYKTIAISQVGKAEPHILPEHHDYVTGLTFSPNGKLLAVFGHAKTLSLIEPATGKEVRKLAGHDKAILAASFSADGKTLATTSEDFTCRIWNVEDGKQKGQLETKKLRAPLLALSPTGKWVAWWDEDAKIRVHDISTGKEEASIKAGGSLFILDWRHCDMRFTPDNKLLALYWSRTLYQWHPDSGVKTREFEPLSGKTHCGRLAPNGKIAAVWDWDYSPSLHLLDLEAGKERVVGVGHFKSVSTILAQPHGKLIASTGNDGTIRLWDPTTSKEIRQRRPESTWNPIAFTPDGKCLISADYDGKDFIRIADLQTEKLLIRMDTERNRQIALSSNGERLLSTDFTRIEVWDATQGKRLRELENVPETKLPALELSEHAPPLTYVVQSLAVSRDGKMAAATYARTGPECRLYLWDTETGKAIAGWPGDKKFRVLPASLHESFRSMC
jgi:WD40 repeat protein